MDDLETPSRYRPLHMVKVVTTTKTVIQSTHTRWYETPDEAFAKIQHDHQTNGLTQRAR